MPNSDLIEIAKALVKRANQGDALAAKGVLEQAAVALRDVTSGRMPDTERIEYLRFLLAALELILDDVSPEKALGLWQSHRPKRIRSDRDLVLFVNVGPAYRRLSTSEEDVVNPVDAAIRLVAKQARMGRPAVEKAWERCGGLKLWRQIESEISDPDTFDSRMFHCVPEWAPIVFGVANQKVLYGTSRGVEHSPAPGG